MAGAGLTTREREVLRLVGEGKANQEIAAALGISVWTVANHRKHICAKLGVHSTAELVAYATGGHPYAVAAGLSDRRHRGAGVDCVLKVDLPQSHGRLKLTYRGRLRQTPGIAEVHIGKKVFHF